MAAMSKRLVAPLIDYCCLVYNSLNQELNTQIERLLNSCIRFIFNVPIDEHITPYYNQLGWLRLPKKREYILGIFLFNLFESKSPEYLYKKFLFKNSVSSRILRTYGLDLQIPIHRTPSHARSFAVFSAKLWNKIPANVRGTKSLSAFKAKYFDLLMSQQRAG